MAEYALSVASFIPIVTKAVVDFWKAGRSYDGDMKRVGEEIETLNGMLDQLRVSGVLEDGEQIPENLERALGHLESVLENCSDRGPSGEASKWRKVKQRTLHPFRRDNLLEAHRVVKDTQINLHTDMLIRKIKALQDLVKQTNWIISETRQIRQVVQRTDEGVQGLRASSQRQAKHRARDEFLKWLAAPNTNEEHCRVREEIDPGSGSWVFDMPQMSAWLQSDEADIVWIRGSPGAGKSVIASNIVEKLLKDHGPGPSVAVAYLYYDSSNQNKFNRLGRVITAIIWQLCCKLEEIPSELMALGGPPRSPAALDTDQIIALGGEFRVVYLVMDGLNEWPSEFRRRLLDLLLHLNSNPTVKFKISVTSTHEIDIERKLQGYRVIDLAAENEKVIRGIKQVMEEKIEYLLRAKGGLCLQNPGLKHEIVSTLSNNSQGIFLWAKLALDDLCEASQYGQDEYTLGHLYGLPKGMEKLYERILKKVKAQDDRLSAIAKKTIGWIAYAREPFIASEMENALFHSGNGDPPKLKMILGACQNMVIQPKGRLEFVHSSLKEYLERDPESQSWMSEAPVSLTNACIDCLSSAVRYWNDRQRANHFDVQNRFPFAEHAADHWGDYAAKALQNPESEETARKILTLLSDGDAAVKIGSLMTPEYEGGEESMGFRIDVGTYPPLGAQHLLAYFGLATLLRALINADKKAAQQAIEQNREPESLPEHDGDRTPLSWAAGNGHLECLQILWEEYRHHRNLGDDTEISPLSWAAIKGRDNIVAWLCRQGGLDIASKDIDGRTAMSHAAENGHDGIIRHLRGINPNLVNIPDEDGSEPIFWAAESNYLDTVKIFIYEFHCKPNFTALLSHAVNSGSVDIVRYLVNTFPGLVEPCPSDGEDAPLLLAVAHGYKDIVEILDGHWAACEDDDVFQALRRELYGLALFKSIKPMFCHAAQKEIAKLLLPKSDPNVRDGNGRTPLIAAAEKGVLDIVRLLLEDPRVKYKERDETGRSALTYARYNNNLSIVNMLEGMEEDDWVSDDDP